MQVAGDPPVPTRALESALAARLREALPPGTSVRVRLIRREGERAIAEVAHTAAVPARAAWNGRLPLPSGGGVPVVTRRTWGTLRGAKAWLRSPVRDRLPSGID